MAVLKDNIGIILLDNRLVPPHFDDAIELFSGTTENTYSSGVDMTSAKAAAETDAAAVITAIGSEISTDKSTCITNTDSILETFKSSWPFASQAAFESAVDALKTSISGAINADIGINVSAYQADAEDAIDTNIPNTAGGAILISDVCEDAKTKLKTAIGAYEAPDTSTPYYGYACGRCGEEGRYPANNDPDEDPTDTTDIECKSCGGLTRTHIPNQAQAVQWPVNEPDYPATP